MGRKTITLIGASGQPYSYFFTEADRVRSEIGGNFVFLLIEPEVVRVLGVGGGDSLADDVADLWPVAVYEHEATHLATRVNPNDKRRVKEVRDLVAKFQPPMNH